MPLNKQKGNMYYLELKGIISSIDNKPLFYRWVEYQGKEKERNLFEIAIYDLMGGVTILKMPIKEFGANRKECMFMKDYFNSEIVKNNEPEIFNSTWSETYAKTHKNNGEILCH